MFQASQRRAATSGANRWLLLAGLGLLVLGLVLRMMLDIGAVGDKASPAADAPPVGTDSAAMTAAAADTQPAVTDSTAMPAAVPAAAVPVAAAPAAAPSGAYIVQLGLFSREANADTIKAKAAALGYSATVHPLQRGTRTLYRVSVDDMPTGDAAKRAADSLGRGLKIEGVVVTHRDGA